MSKFKAFLLEAVQFIPVITLASSFIVSGGVDLSRAATLFVVSGVGAFLITVALVIKKVQLNPILLGTNIWLCAGALAFGLPVPPLAALLAKLQAFGLFVCVAGISLPLFFSPTGFIGMRHPDVAVVRKLSFLLLAATVVVLIWTFFLMDDIRLGGGLPFILLNVTRRMMMRRNRPKTGSASA